MTTTDRRDATDAQFADELARLDRLDVADEDTVERVARAMWEEAVRGVGAGVAWEDAGDAFVRPTYRRQAAAAIDALKPAPSTDTSTEDALHRVLDLADELLQETTENTRASRSFEAAGKFDGAAVAAAKAWTSGAAAARIRAAVAGPQRDGEGDDQLRRCIHCGALCDHRVQACECGPDCPLPKVAR